MNHLRQFKQKLAAISRRMAENDYDKALAEVEVMLTAWPGNAYLHLLLASLIQLQEDPVHSLDDARQALQRAVELDKGSPAGAIELGHFLDNVDDDPKAASKAYTHGVTAARQLLIDGLIGQAKALQQLGKREEFRRCLLEVLTLVRFERDFKHNTEDTGADIIVESPPGHFYALQLKGPYAEQIQSLLSESIAERAAS